MSKSLEERVAALEARVNRLEPHVERTIPLGPKPISSEEMSRGIQEAFDKLVRPVPPVDRNNEVLVSGKPVPEDRSHTKINEKTGQQEDYVVLSADERNKGFVRPYRDAYRHSKCGKITTMSRAIAETYARDPFFYSGTFCSTCRDHFPVGQTGEFNWYEMEGREGPKVGT